MSAVIQYECRVSISGYRIIRFDQQKFSELEADDDGTVAPPAGATDDERYLLEQFGGQLLPFGGKPEVFEVIVPNSEKTRDFDLFEHPYSIFLEFAGTPLTREGILAFSKKWGPLFGASLQLVSNWKRAVRRMSQAVKQWDAAKKNGDFRELVRLVEYGPKCPRDPLQRTGIGVEAFLREIDGGTPRLCISPPTLLEALWVQLICSVDGRKNFRPCSECGSWFQIEAGGSRDDRQYCSSACRQRAYRLRKDQRR